MPTTTRTSGDFRQPPTRSPIDSNDAFVLTLWTNDAVLAARADAAGVQRIGVDLERMGKVERQRGLGTWISPHTVADLRIVSSALTRASAFVRVNPIHDGSPREIEDVLAAGARVIMLPMVASAREAAAITTMVGGRARVVLLVECARAIEELPSLVAVAGVDEIHLGLNDLALSLGLRNRWLALASDLVVEAAGHVLNAGLRLGLGGIGRVDDGALPMPADLVYAQYARTGATAALLARSFHLDPARDLGREVGLARDRLAWWARRSPEAIARAHSEFVKRAEAAGSW